MNKIKLLLFSLLLSSNTFSQVQWERLFSKDSTDVFRSVQEVPAGGYVLAGYTSEGAVNDSDAYVVRLDVNGDTIWTYTYNGSSSKKDLFYKVINTSDGGFITCGYTNSVSGGSDNFLYVKLNSSGQEVWRKTYGGSGKDRAQDIVEVSDGYTIAGYTTSSPAQYYDALLLHVDFNGDVVWDEIYGDQNYDDANTLKQLPDGGYILGGQSDSNGNFEQYLIRTNESGDLIWERKFGTNFIDNIESLVLVSDGFVFAGSTNDQTSDNGYLVKTDTAGIVQWTKIFGDSAQDDFHRVDKTSDGGFILSGTTSSYGPANPNMWLVKTDAQGNQQWSITPGGGNHDHGYSAVQTNDGGYIIVGHTGSFGFHNEEGYVVKIGPSGNPITEMTYVTALVLLEPTCSGTSSQVKVVLANFGYTDVTNVILTVDITGGLTQTIVEAIPGTFYHQSFDTITMATTINTTGGGSYTFNGYTNITNDVYPQRNSFQLTRVLPPCTGIEDLQTDLGYTVYPNPSDGNFVLDFSEQYSKANVEIFNSTGAIIKSFTVADTYNLKTRTDLSEFADGIYFLKITTGGYYDVKKIILKR